MKYKLLKKAKFLVCILSITIGILSCEKKILKKIIIYDGPIAEVKNVKLLYSDSSHLVMMLEAPIQQELKNKDVVFSKGLKLTYYDTKGLIVNTLRADSAYHTQINNTWYAFGDVQLHNIPKKEKLLTEELIWIPMDHRVETKKYIRIETPDQNLEGIGLNAKDDFSEYEILSPVLEINVN